MADAKTLVKSPTETLKAFNKRILDACESSDEVTHAQLEVVNGQPVVTLLAELVEVDPDPADTAAEAERAADAETEFEPSSPPILVRVCQLYAGTQEEAVKTEERLDTLFNIADGAVAEVITKHGEIFGWVANHPDNVKAGQPPQVWQKQVVSYQLVAYDAEDAADGDDTEDVTKAPTAAIARKRS